MAPRLFNQARCGRALLLAFAVAIISTMIVSSIAIIRWISETEIPLGYHGDALLYNEQIRLVFSETAAGISNYTDNTLEPTGWELFSSMFWDSSGDGVIDSDESIGHTLSPCVHFTLDSQPHHFWPMHESVLQEPGDPKIVSSGWISYPNVYYSKVEDAGQLITVESVVSLLDGNNYFTQDINITSTALSSLIDVNLIAYVGLDINGGFDDFAFIDSVYSNMLKAYDNKTDVWFGAYPTIAAENYEVSEWNDGPFEGDDLWQHTLDNGLTAVDQLNGDVEAALEFNLGDIEPGQNKNLTIYYSFGLNENDLYLPIPLGHDVAVTEIAKSKEIVGEGYGAEINVTVANEGEYSESFNITVYADEDTAVIGDELTIGEAPVYFLTNGSVTTLTFTWDTTATTKGNYTISAIADSVSGETDLMDNTLIDKWIFVTLAGDVDGDKDVDIYDIVQVCSCYGTEEGDPQYIAECDIDGDGDVDIYDIVIICNNYGESYP